MLQRYKKLSYVAVSIMCLSLDAHAELTKIESLHTFPSQASIDYFSINAKNNNINLGLLGVHYGLNLLPVRNLYTGLGIYGAVSGSMGGFFAFGVDDDYRPQLYKSLYADIGFFFGGGGAHSLQAGGGLMLLPHAGFSYKIGAARIKLDYSYIAFPSGIINGSQVMLGVIFPDTFDFFAPTDFSDKSDNIHWKMDSLYLSPIIQMYSSSFGLVGAEGGKFISNRAYVALRATAIAKGNEGNGYMAAMGGIGYQYPLTHHFYFTNDVFVGSGGGGQLDTGNGILLEADTGFAWQLVSCGITPKILIGYLTAPDGHFNSWVGTLGLYYNLGWLSVPNDANTQHYYVPINSIQHWRVALFNQTYFYPQRNDTRNGNINLLGASLEQQLNTHVYLSYRTGFAYQGEHSTALATGSIGAGYQFNTAQRVHPHAEMLLGAAGGGGVAVGGGLFVEPEVGLRFNIKSCFGIDTSVGQMISTTGHFNTTILNVGGVFSFGKLV